MSRTGSVDVSMSSPGVPHAVSWDHPSTRPTGRTCFAGFSLFSGIRKRRLRKLVRHATFAEFAPGDTVVMRDEPAEFALRHPQRHGEAKGKARGSCAPRRRLLRRAGPLRWRPTLRDSCRDARAPRYETATPVVPSASSQLRSRDLSAGMFRNLGSAVYSVGSRLRRPSVSRRDGARDPSAALPERSPGSSSMHYASPSIAADREIRRPASSV